MKFSNFFRKDAEEEIHQKMNQHLSKIQLATQSLIKAVEVWQKSDVANLDFETGNIAAEEHAVHFEEEMKPRTVIYHTPVSELRRHQRRQGIVGHSYV